MNRKVSGGDVIVPSTLKNAFDNRVGVEIRSSAIHGLGLFAPRDLPSTTVVLTDNILATKGACVCKRAASVECPNCYFTVYCTVCAPPGAVKANNSVAQPKRNANKGSNKGKKGNGKSAVETGDGSNDVFGNDKQYGDPQESESIHNIVCKALQYCRNIPEDMFSLTTNITEYAQMALHYIAKDLNEANDVSPALKALTKIRYQPFSLTNTSYAVLDEIFRLINVGVTNSYTLGDLIQSFAAVSPNFLCQAAVYENNPHSISLSPTHESVVMASVSLLNHSCVPNATIVPDVEFPDTFHVQLLRPVAEGEEITISYIEGLCQDAPLMTRRSYIAARWKFRCRCVACDKGVYRQWLEGLNHGLMCANMKCAMHPAVVPMRHLCMGLFPESVEPVVRLLRAIYIHCSSGGRVRVDPKIEAFLKSSPPFVIPTLAAVGTDEATCVSCGTSFSDSFKVDIHPTQGQMPHYKLVTDWFKTYKDIRSPEGIIDVAKKGLALYEDCGSNSKENKENRKNANANANRGPTPNTVFDMRPSGSFEKDWTPVYCALTYGAFWRLLVRLPSDKLLDEGTTGLENLTQMSYITGGLLPTNLSWALSQAPVAYERALSGKYMLSFSAHLRGGFRAFMTGDLAALNVIKKAGEATRKPSPEWVNADLVTCVDKLINDAINGTLGVEKSIPLHGVASPNAALIAKRCMDYWDLQDKGIVSSKHDPVSFAGVKKAAEFQLRGILISCFNAYQIGSSIAALSDSPIE